MNINSIMVSEESKYNFLKGLIRVSKADKFVDQEEREFFTAAAMQLSLSTEYITELELLWDSVDHISVTFENMVQKLLFIREAIQLCAISNSYVESERNEIKAIARELAITDEKISEIECWVEEGLRWTKQGDLIIQG